MDLTQVPTFLSHQINQISSSSTGEWLNSALPQVKNLIQTFISYSGTTSHWFNSIGPGLLGLIKSTGNAFIVVLQGLINVIKWFLTLLP